MYVSVQASLPYRCAFRHASVRICIHCSSEANGARQLTVPVKQDVADGICMENLHLLAYLRERSPKWLFVQIKLPPYSKICRRRLPIRKPRSGVGVFAPAVHGSSHQGHRGMYACDCGLRANLRGHCGHREEPVYWPNCRGEKLRQRRMASAHARVLSSLLRHHRYAL